MCASPRRGQGYADEAPETAGSKWPPEAPFDLAFFPLRAEHPVRAENAEGVQQQAKPPAADHPKHPQALWRLDQVDRHKSEIHQHVAKAMLVELAQPAHVFESFRLLFFAGGNFCHRHLSFRIKGGEIQLEHGSD